MTLMSPTCRHSVRDNSSLNIITYEADPTVVPVPSDREIFQSIINCTGFNIAQLFPSASLCQNVLTFTCYYNSTSCSGTYSSCMLYCPKCTVDCVVYVPAADCSEHVFIIIRTVCSNYSGAGGCTGYVSPDSTCCSPNGVNVHTIEFGVTVGFCAALLFVAATIGVCAIVLFLRRPAARIRGTRYAHVHVRACT